jgi:hypothetical protein
MSDEPTAEEFVDEIEDEENYDSDFRYIALLALSELLDSADETIVFEAAAAILDHTS